VRWHRPRPLAWTSVVVLVALLVLAGCGGKAPSGGGGGGSEGGELTLWTHNAGNPQELGVVKQIVNDYNASQTKNQVKIQAFPQATYNDAVTAAATARKLPCILDVDAELSEAIRQRLEAGPSSFHVLVPNTRAGDLASRVARSAPLAPTVGDAAFDVQATEHAQHRLGQLLRDLRELGADVDGELGDEDALKAATEVLERQQFDEIILSTLPQPISRWLGMDLPHRLHRHSGLPVTTITTKRVI
jgi:hypothetical protein